MQYQQKCLSTAKTDCGIILDQKLINLLKVVWKQYSTVDKVNLK